MLLNAWKSARLNLVQMFITHFEQLKPVLQVGLEKGIRVAFIQYLMTLLGDHSLSILSILAVHKEQSIRLRTVIPLAEIGTSKAKAIMKGLMNDSDHEVATTAKHLGNLHESFINHSSVNLKEKSSLLEFRTLGQFRVFIDGVEINPESWRTVKVRDLLAYLIHNTEPVNTCQIIEDLWFQFDKAKATANFHTTLYQLRQRLKRAGYENLVEYGGRYYFIQPTNYCTDYQRFENLIKALLKNGVSKENVAFLEEALSLYCGNYLADLDYEWIIPKQERLKQLYSDTCMALSHFYLELQEFDLAIRHLRSLQVNNPYNEEVSCRLMTAYAGKGDRAAVLKEFERLKRELRKDLGLEPSENTIKIYHRLYH
jgi:two-component SAPR family response regulator